MKMQQAMAETDISKAQALYDELDQNYSSTTVARRAKNIGEELEVFEPMFDIGTVDINWLQGKESAQLGRMVLLY